MIRGTTDPFEVWIEALERRHFSELTFQEVRRALQALSSLYVERRERLAGGGALDGAGKRAAFALFYGPLHFLVTQQIVRQLQAADPPPVRICDLGCGTGAAGAAWALEARTPPPLVGIDTRRWALDEARWTWRQLGLAGSVREGRAELVRPEKTGTGVLAAYLVNELPASAREALLDRLVASAERGARVLVIEPISRRASPWWDAWSLRFRHLGGRADTWRFSAELPELTRRLDRAAGLDHRELTARSLYSRPSTSGPCSKTTSTGTPADAS